MKAVLLQGYGGVEQLEYAETAQPSPGPGEVLVKVEGTSVNPIDFKLRRGDMKAQMPLEFPAILGRDVAGKVVEDTTGTFETGARVMGLVNHAYAEFLVAKATDLSRIPDGLATEDAAALSLVLLTGTQLIEAGVKPVQGETILVTGALGSVGRTAVYVAMEHGARVIAGVRGNQLEQAGRLGAAQVLAIDDEAAIAQLPLVDAIADTVGHDVIGKLLKRLKPGGRLATVVGEPEAAEGLDIQVEDVWARPDAQRLLELAETVRQGKLLIPIAQKLPLAEAGKAQQLAEKGSAGGKIVLLV